MIQTIMKDAEERMKKSVEALKTEFSKVRTSRAHPSLLEHVRVAYYGNEVPLSQVSSITATDARTLMVTPWEKNMIGPIEKAIRQSDLGLNPASQGEGIRVPLPLLTEERRKEMVKVIRHETENSRVAIRNVRRDANTHAKTLLKDKKISEDEDRRLEEQVQKMTDKYIAEVERLLSVKEKDVMEI